MAAYVIAQVDVQDEAGFGRYRELVPGTIEQYGGRYIVRGGKVEQLEGEWDPKRLVIIEFETAERARAWWASEEYRDARDLRQRTALTKLAIVQGV